MKKVFKLLLISLVVTVMCFAVRVDAKTVNSNIVDIKQYSPDTNEPRVLCATGQEDTCVSVEVDSASVGDFVEFKVDSSNSIKYRVISVTSNTLTLISSSIENTFSSAYNLSASYSSIVNTVKALEYPNANTTDMFNSRARLISYQELGELGCDTSSSTNCPEYVYNDNTGSGMCTHVLVGTKQNNNIMGVKVADGIIENISTSDDGNVSNLCYRTVINVDKYSDEADGYSSYNDGKGSTEEGSNDASDNSDTVNVGDTLKIAYVGYVVGLLVLIIGAYIIYKSVKDSEVNIEE